MHLGKKLEIIAFDTNSVKWVNSYLTDRFQQAEVGGQLSEPEPITCGVPQGSILGPLFFLIYVNDMSSAISSKLILYADDSAIIYSAKSIKEIETVLSLELTSIQSWLIDNKLSLHLGKTEAILFGSRRKLTKSPKLNMSCNDTSIISKNSVNYLGVELDQQLSGEATACKVIQKCNSRLKFLFRHSKLLNTRCKRQLANALVLCHFDYASSFWYSGLRNSTKSKLQICQNKLARFVLNKHHRSHIGLAEFQRLGWLPISHRVQQLKLIQVFKITHDLSPSYLKSDFRSVSQMHSYSTRRRESNAFWVPQSGAIVQVTFYRTAIIAWNSLPVTLRTARRLSFFKSGLKKYIYDKLKALENSSFLFF